MREHGRGGAGVDGDDGVAAARPRPGPDGTAGGAAGYHGKVTFSCVRFEAGQWDQLMERSGGAKREGGREDRLEAGCES